SNWLENGWFTAAASGAIISLFVFDSSDSHIYNYDLDLNCNITEDTAAPSGTINPGATARNLTAGTEMDGQAVYLFNTAGSPHTVRYTRVVPNKALAANQVVVPSLTAYTEPLSLVSARMSSDFVPLAFVRAAPGPVSDGCTGTGWCLYYVNYPLPLNGEASVNNPWATKLGAPL